MSTRLIKNNFLHSIIRRYPKIKIQFIGRLIYRSNINKLHRVHNMELSQLLTINVVNRNVNRITIRKHL